MEACTVPLRVKLPEFINKTEFLGEHFTSPQEDAEQTTQKTDAYNSIGSNLNPVVVLTDFRKCPKGNLEKSISTSPVKEEPEEMETHTLPEVGKDSKGAKGSKMGATLTGSGDIASNPKRFGSVKRKRESWDPSVEYEVEKIVGYHRDKRNKMWYLVKWKNWTSNHNTFEPIENLTRCNYELMKYFEMMEPPDEDIIRKNFEIEGGVRKRAIYIKLRNNDCGSESLEEFMREFPDSRQLFHGNLDDLEKRIREEYGYIIRCLIGMYSHQDDGLIQRAQNYLLFLHLIQLRRKQLEHNASFERLINSQEKTTVVIENKVDLVEFPNIDYIVDLKPGPGVVLPKEPLLGCECPTGCSLKSPCCGKIADSRFAYKENGKLRTVQERFAIYECNDRCSCPPSCPNRVVQRGRQVKLCIFRTETCGWGVKALEKIPKGTFVCEYIGELIPDSEAVVRDTYYYKENKGYLFDLDFFMDPKLDMYCIDATTQGNLARFINHSCDPNLVVFPVWIDGLAPNLHRLGFFARRNIRKNEEIHFDYENLEDMGTVETAEDANMGHNLRMLSNVRCQCKAANCREWIFGNK